MTLVEYANDEKIDVSKVIKMVLIHDIVEIDAGDTFLYDSSLQSEKCTKETQAAKRIFGLLPGDQQREFLQLWSEFYSTEQQIRSETAAVQQRIDSFLSVIESSAILFREGLNLLKLQRDINDALSLFTEDMPQMEQLSKDMEQSWSHLDMLVNTLTSMSINISHN
jgi:5'-deoxynucleotidase YfbR-like HD superfamily hydrolase